MFSHAVKLVSKAMFPIFRIDPTGVNQFNVGVVGTGFFISSNGNFVSVAHVFDNSGPQTKFIYLGRLPDKLENPSVDISEVCRDDSQDLYVGKIQKKTPDFLKLSDKLSNVGRTVCIGGYPLAQITNNAQGGLEVGGVRRYFQPSFVLDHWVINSTSDSGLVRKHDGLLLRDESLFGMSGGPVFDTSATVVGVQGSVTSPRSSVNSIGRTISVENAVAIRSNLVLSILKQHNIRLN